jgi:hypothetical protein
MGTVTIFSKFEAIFPGLFLKFPGVHGNSREFPEIPENSRKFPGNSLVFALVVD